MSKDDEIKIEADESLDDSVVAEENAVETVAKLRAKLKTCEAESREYLTGWQRAKADLINARKRDDDDRKEFAKFANERLIADIIPALEHYDMAKSHKESWEKADKGWREGVEGIFGQLKRVLTDYGLVEINPIGQKFDHNLHEALSREPVADPNLDHTVINVIQKGYSLNGKLIRPAKVTVGEFVKEG